MSKGDDPLLAESWVEDPWDDPASVPESSLDSDQRTFDHLRGPFRHLVTILVAVALLVGACGLWVVHELNPGGTPGVAVNFTVNDGDTLDSVADRLSEAGIIRNKRLFVWYVKSRGGLDLLPGYYSLRPGESAGDVVRSLSTPPAQTFVKVTFPEGMTVAQMGDRLAAKITFMSTAEFATAASDGSVVSALAPEGTRSLEGLLFPDTYQVSGDDTEQRVVSRLSTTMERVARQLDLEAGAKALGYTPYQVLIVASLVEREAKVPEDRAKIAQVIWNRLARKMNLEIDATLLYGADPAASFADLKAKDTPYNSYMHPGLPPTPIANPGKASIKAALAPAGRPPAGDEACAGLKPGTKCDYLYYVLADKSGRHVFATTYEQHLANVEKSRAAGVLP